MKILAPSLRLASLLVLATACGGEDPTDGGLPGPDAGETSRDAGRLDGGARDAGGGDASAGDAGGDGGARDASLDGAAGDAALADADGGTLDGGAPSLGLSAPSWWRSIQGVTTLGGPFAEVLPDGTVVLAMNGGYFSRTLTVGEGEAEEVTFPVHFDPVVAWLDGDDGTLLRARHVAIDATEGVGSSVTMRAIAPTSAGSLLAIGDWHGSSVFHPDTAGAVTLSAERRLVGDTLHRAEDPYFTRWDADAAPEWTRRGRTPGPLSQTWFNYGIGLAALVDGGALVSGQYEASGFVLGDGTSGATTLGGTRQSYFARLGPDGVPTFVARNTGDVRLWAGLRSAGGIAYALIELGSDVTLNADGAEPVMIARATGTGTTRTLALVRFADDGAIVWARRIVLEGSGSAATDFEVRDDGSVAIAGIAGSMVSLRDAADASTHAREGGGFVASYSAEGAPEWVTGVGLERVLEVAALASGEVWLATVAPATTRELALAGGTFVVPELGLPDDAQLSLLHRVTREGEVVEARLIGADLGVRDLGSRRLAGQPGLVAAGLSHCHDSARTPQVVAPSGLELTPLPACEPSSNERASVLSLDL